MREPVFKKNIGLRDHLSRDLHHGCFRWPVLEAKEDTDEQLKIVNLIQLQDIVTDQAENEDLQANKDKLIHRHNIYYKKINKEKKIILSEEFHA
ncbi:hypothetical protein ACUWC2_28395, partial [Klebsiella pneumoniae]|uniref:hypothetical protein n=1 Tax=Klebsiella pneumoniae TaxID=573 RepID=UPI004055523C